MPLDKLESHLLRSLPRELGGLDGSTTAGIVECHYPVKLRDNLFEDLKAFRGEICGRLVDARESSPRFCEAIHNSENNWIGPCAENDGDLCGRPPCCYGAISGSCINQVNFLLFEFRRCLFRRLCIPLPISD